MQQTGNHDFGIPLSEKGWYELSQLAILYNG